LGVQIDAGFALALPWLRGVGFYAPHVLEDFKPGQLDHAYLSDSWSRQANATEILDLIWERLPDNGVLAVHAEQSVFSRQKFGEHVLKWPAWRCLDDMEGVPGAPTSWFAALMKIPVQAQVYEPLERQNRDVLVIRTGGFGDGLLASYVASRLKKADPDRHVTYLVSENAGKVLQNNPNIDRLLVFERHRYGDESFGQMAHNFVPRFQKLIYLNETVESLLLPGSKNGWFHWPHALRHELCNRNYEEVTSAVAELTHEPGHVGFYPFVEEVEKAKLPEGTNVAWALSGSTEHKTWPYQGIALARLLLKYPKINFHLLGGGDRDRKLIHAVLQQVEQIAGKHELARVYHDLDEDLRVSYAKAQRCDVVVAPETGVLWACAYSPNQKIVLLSHSSSENLTKHWRFTQGLEPQDCAQFPCHKLHFAGDECPTNADGVSVCAAAIPVDAVVTAVDRALENITVLSSPALVYDTADPEPAPIAAD